ncbi:TetR/AcrR family transcriptional regulator [Plectonema cf. radiosum LEGE 06105]|uniref:TetR/AcrR family transcriptional regulator n=2 Tax=Plectonema TaxID=1183 RepID=A0A8J7K3B7_9CYAN|nr:TetR/AcrR family transcriptional regulator [Plectonema cf. radiosum LEGE 06105]
MSKGEETKERILYQAAALFNTQGYAGASISDIMRVTGLKKGGIYNHFQSKDELALQAFDYAIDLIKQRYRGALKNKRHAVERLQAIISVFSTNVENPAVEGGCPLLNTAVESDDAHPILRQRAQTAMDSWRDMVCKVIQKGIARGEIRPKVNPDEVATIMITLLEGAVMMSKLYDDSIHLERAIKHLNNYIQVELQT